MGQAEVEKILNDNGGWLLSKEIAQKAKISLGSVQASLQRMIKYGEVLKKKVVLKEAQKPSYAYKLKA
ncbi:hypothetical protein CL622_02255 [archaeon]|nr:hypothetical protein [archaeon]|tara:strand:+ start:225 stop:428 length:204 start_codon:yes stop_codon:yes gene_type:complete